MEPKWTWHELRNKCRTPAGLVAVLWGLGWGLLEVKGNAEQVSEYLPGILRILASPIAIPIFLIAGLGLIFWELHDIRKTSGDVVKFKVRHHFLVSAISAGAVILLGAIVLIIISFAHTKPKETTHSEPPDSNKPPVALPQPATKHKKAPPETAYEYRNEMSASQVATVIEHLSGAIKQMKPVVFVMTTAPGSEKFKDEINSLIVHACDRARTTGSGSPCTIEPPPDPRFEINTDIPVPTRSGIVVHSTEPNTVVGGAVLAIVLGGCYKTFHSSQMPDAIKKVGGASQGENLVWLELGPGSPWNLGSAC